VHSLEKEIMRLQEVLKERETEIAALEGSLKESKAAVAPLPNGVNGVDHGAPSPPPVDPITPQSTAGVDGHANPNLSPKTISQFDNIRRSMSHEPPHKQSHSVTDSESDINGGSSVFSDPDESLERLNELMLWVVRLWVLLRRLIFSCQPGPWRRRRATTARLSRTSTASSHRCAGSMMI
jgi:kinesin family protein 4/21/27